MEQRQVPLSRPSIGSKEIEAVLEVLESGWLAPGKYNRKFEEAFAQLIGVPYAITMNSGTSALEAALQVAGIKGEVIVPSFTFVATANAVVNAGAIPVFCDVDEATRNVTAKLIEEWITSRTEAIIVVHYGGQPCQMGDIIRLCERHHLLLIEDSAETIGATWQGQQAGSFGIGCFSFFPIKNITTGEGGMLTCIDSEFAQRVRAFIAHGISSTTLDRERMERPWIREAEMAGHNYRMSDILAAIGYHQLLRLEEMNNRRVALARRYDALLADLTSTICTPGVAEGATHVYQIYTVKVSESLRDALLHYLRRCGVGASVHFDPPVHRQPFYLARGGTRLELPVTDRLANCLITLPLYPEMTEEDQDYVVNCIREGSDEVQ